ncbi:MAG: hypothetical protein Q8P17_04310 [bacterium]|nr:hypothetical protein [bacterium]
MMKKIYITLGIVLATGVGFVVVTQILFRGDYYRQFEQKVFYKNCPAYVYITGEYTGITPEIAVIKSAVDSLGFEKVDVSQLEDKKIKVIVAGSDNQMNAMNDKVNGALSEFGDFQIEKMEGGGAYKAKTCPLD